MAFIILLFLGLVLLPFFALGLKRVWVVAAPIWVAVTAYAIFVWTLPIDPAEDWQMASFWRMVLLASVVGSVGAFAAGLIVAYFKSRGRGQSKTDLEETFE
jgi:hypothetical protein